MSDIAALLERYRRGPELLALVLTGVFGEEEDFVPAPGKWSARQIVAHVADAELVSAHRFRQMIAEENPTLVAYNQDAWAADLDYAKRKPKQSLETFRRLRAENYELLKGLAESAFARTGNHTQNGPMTLRQLLEDAAGHAEAHARQLQGLRAEYKKIKKAASSR
jgi:DinB superfamily